MSEIAQFMVGEIPDRLGRYFNEILSYEHFWLEHDHKYIQVLFPIDEGTKFNKHAPLVTENVRKIFAVNADLKATHLKALDLMLAFWGLRRSGEIISVNLPLELSKHVWLKPYDHNQLRLTRVIRSLTLLGNKTIAENLVECLVHAANESKTVSGKTITFWCNALDETLVGS